MDFACNGSAELNCYTKGAEFLTGNGFHAQANTTKVVKANEDWRTPLPSDVPVTKSYCGNCTVCVSRCPAKALTGKLWTPETGREALFHKEDCKKTQIQRMKQATGIETNLCGLCFAVCPYTQKYCNR